MTLRPFIWILLLAAGLAAALWWNRDLPAVQRLWPALGIARTALPDLRPAAPKPGGTLRKCRSAGQVLYTDGTCPPGSREEAADGGTVTVLPAAPAAAASAGAAAASVQTPLRRLAGQGGAPDQQERRVEQALNR